MMQKVNSKYAALFTQRPRYVILMGGRGAGRSTVASQYATSKLVAPEYFRCAIMRYVLGDIRNSIYREIIDRTQEAEIKGALEINDSQMSLSYGANSINAVGFKKSSGEQKAKLKSLANYTTVIIEEADEIPEADFLQLDDSIRTMKGDITIILLLNSPPRSHWIIERWFDLALVPGLKDFYIPSLKSGITDTIFISSSFEDNILNLDQKTVENYRNYERTKPAHFYNMIKGYVPEVVKGKIYSGWREIDEVPHEARLEFYGLDYGYSNDPTAITAIYYHDGGYIFDEIAHQKGLSNRQIANILLSHPLAPVVPDSAEPKSNDELKDYGLTVIPATKGAGSVNQGIQFVQAQRCSYTKRSANIKKGFENYAWMTDKDGNIINVPNHLYSDAMDSIRYPMQTIKVQTEPDEEESASRLMSRLKNASTQTR